MSKHVVSALKAQDATETNKTVVGHILVPQGVKRLIGIGSQISSAGLTDLEDLTHIIEVESNDMAPWGGTQQFLAGGSVATLKTSGVMICPVQIQPCSVAVQPGSTLIVSATFNRALTINPSVRVQCIFE